MSHTNPQPEIQASSIKVGDVVRLRPGGPLMTVSAIWPTRYGVFTVWIDESGAPHDASFPAVALQLERGAR